ncbi:C-type lectin domain-containing protein [Caenorhabditis elegans]|uniref:C-type lectin domain-containing protein n=1 Tax=Caenorhabditis elegans TaxID=6239 RepID=Q9U201_CAEEL|nr:C-type lectin domain-containing protein [Caenorhabditis elegans]CAB60390.2 C-type lectin domain-containing protein [Caenorhabditis elegans]|eukprot:NP_507868.2 C-type LECtin [Caenorhabditis elegans]
MGRPTRQKQSNIRNLANWKAAQAEARILAEEQQRGSTQNRRATLPAASPRQLNGRLTNGPRRSSTPRSSIATSSQAVKRKLRSLANIIYFSFLLAFFGNNKHDGAEAACQAQGAKLSGFQTTDESMRATHLLRAVINQASPGANTVAWLGGIRKASCPTVQSCTPANSYQWTDGHTTGTAGFTFGVNQPDILGGVQFCLTQNVHAKVDSGLTSAQWHFFNGNLDDVECYATLNTYLCGKVPN